MFLKLKKLCIEEDKETYQDSIDHREKKIKNRKTRVVAQIEIHLPHVKENSYNQCHYDAKENII